MSLVTCHAMALLIEVDLSPVSVILFVQTLLMIRYSGLPGWLYEHRNGANRGVREWSAEEQVWWCLHKRQQRCVLDFRICFFVFVHIISVLPVSWCLLSECKCSVIHQHDEANPHRWCLDPSGAALPFLSCNSKAINLLHSDSMLPFNLCTCCLEEFLRKGKCIRCCCWCNWHLASPYQLYGYG